MKTSAMPRPWPKALGGIDAIAGNSLYMRTPERPCLRTRHKPE